MTKKTKEELKKQNEMLGILREQQNVKVNQAQTMLKKQMNIRKEIRKAIQTEPKTIPQISEITGLASSEVLWYIASMKKYGDVVEVGMDDDYEYYLYSLSKEVKK